MQLAVDFWDARIQHATTTVTIEPRPPDFVGQRYADNSYHLAWAQAVVTSADWLASCLPAGRSLPTPLSTSEKAERNQRRVPHHIIGPAQHRNRDVHATVIRSRSRPSSGRVVHRPGLQRRLVFTLAINQNLCPPQRVARRCSPPHGYR